MRTFKGTAVLVCLISAAACSSGVDVDKVPVGTQVEVTKADGGVVAGQLTDKTKDNVTLKTGKSTRTVPRASISDVRLVNDATPKELPKVAKFREYIVPEGTSLHLRLADTISSATSQVEEKVSAALVDDITIDGAEVIPAGSIVHGQVTKAEGSAKVKGLASLAVHFTSIAVAGRDSLPIDATFADTAESTKKEDAKKIGIGAAAGAIIGGIAGGGKGAAIGAGVGGGAGTAVVVSTKGKEVTLEQGATLRVTLKNEVLVKVPIKP